MAGELQPLAQNFKVVDENGFPTLYFIKWAQQRQLDIGDSITLADLQAYLTAHKLREGSGIQFTPDGDINNAPLITADFQEILDQISATRGTILYRGLLGWAALAPGTATYLLQTNGAGADPSWVAPSSGGSGSLTRLATITLAATAPNITFSGISGAYKDLIIIGQLRSDKAATSDELRLQLNTDTGANYDYRRSNDVGATQAFAAAFVEVMSVSANTAPANVASTFSLEIENYSSTVFHKQMFLQGEFMLVASANNFLHQRSVGRWRNTAAVTEVKIFSPASNLVIGSTVSLYGRG